MKVEVKTIDNRKKGDIELSDSIFAIEPRADVVAKYLYKGAKVTVVGSGKLRTYPKKDGSEGSSLELRVNDFTLPEKQEGDSPF